MKNDQFVLNKSQEEAVKSNNGPLLIIAGAGTGKTTVITERIKYVIGKGLAKPEEILALTFTEKASQQMEKRVDLALPYGTFGLWISTFHSFSDRILRSEALHIGLTSNFKLMSEAETYLFVKKHFWRFDLQYFRPKGNPYKFIEGLIQHFERIRDEDVSAKDYLTFAQKHEQDKSSASEKEEAKKYLELAKAFQTYEELKIKEGVMDFSDLITNVLNLFRKRKSILARYQRQFKYILLDEFQDTNFAQYQLIKLLAPSRAKPNLTVVGDDSQSIYKFRGAAISNILSFMKDYPSARHIILTTSYRCPQIILDSAYSLIKYNNPNTLESQLKISKDLQANQSLKGEKIEFIQSERVEEEAEKIAFFILAYKNENKKEYKDFAILVRANNHSAPFIRALERAKISYQFLGPGMLFQKPEVKDLIAYLKVLSDFTDSTSLYRVLSMEIWRIEARDIIAVLNLAKRSNHSFFEMLEKIEKNEQAEIQNSDKERYKKYKNYLTISEDSNKKFSEFVKMVHKHQKLIHKETAGQILYYFLLDSGLLSKIVDYKTQAEERKALNITKFFDKLKSFEATHEDASVFTVVDYLELAMNMGESPLAAEVDWSETDAVNILTVHSAKGLEFPVVFLTNLVEGRFPSRQRKDQIPIPEEVIQEVLPIGDYHLQEERRLFYVAMTRAKEKLVFSASNFYGEGKLERKLSPFISESLGLEKQTRSSLDLQISQIPLFEWKRTSDEAESTETNLPSKLKLDYLSYSAIKTFEICPLHFKLRYILHLPSAPTAAQSLGNSIHYALRDFYSLSQTSSKLARNEIKGKEPEFIINLLNVNWISDGYKSKVHEQQSKEVAIIFLQKYLKSELHHKAKPLYLERSFNFTIGSTGIKILGKIDRVDDLGDGCIEIIDYKTGENIPSKKALDKDLQMTIYALAAVNPGIFRKSIDQVKLSFYFLNTSTKMSTIRTSEQLNFAIDEILKIRDLIEQSDFKCSGAIICQNCEYKILCNG
ncbi:hypothetical protein A3C98_01015 [Candidatus Roizmanbacteria bacterium RIFCSPHIGHO2_02_FULL_37_15]|uniref:DNA 3'-5' helicase n=1 Tax=Candidatus Roizmanbacteria bacterium RIFCSPLOWO2_01_FULL_37_16 TaxID=1802058 RepID=A0A1F7IPF9_9BACT|nr:MAG: hypothetical protein A2859_03300 [Candidatus Roizmanbacteria bacterium RIFCSPHIGHO2_01_FULL_37_16b]OGK21776.1 MAG: hypothetical protein A3C98_01015 [Candidatus Roizmanbacteria bacterium RIFCSPHIGHO2_02_FULL_37_15]OGK33717.1 MAG: hypothetical protein A3F57_04615 [Candidatus Roizmanbacteria bacterium RIFCSPHIGHO2_12_FULL_36_11]OGK45221.1 MAG: hypothetical protein A3B40_03190 [Candidatus Roizmanbacteria bacterium RIFCSPLOWO2_01_FULL_37_16]OGK57578.1 MAG: hypothetical protein A3I50_00255 [C